MAVPTERLANLVDSLRKSGRFGFVPASLFGIISQHDARDEFFMVRESVPGTLNNQHGTIHYHAAFNAV